MLPLDETLDLFFSEKHVMLCPGPGPPDRTRTKAKVQRISNHNKAVFERVFKHLQPGQLFFGGVSVRIPETLGCLDRCIADSTLLATYSRRASRWRHGG